MVIFVWSRTMAMSTTRELKVHEHSYRSVIVPSTIHTPRDGVCRLTRLCARHSEAAGELRSASCGLGITKKART